MSLSMTFHGTSRSGRAVLLACLCTLAACASGEGKVGGDDASSTDDLNLPPMPVGGEPGTFLLVFEHNATDREAIVHVPESYDPTAPTPLRKGEGQGRCEPSSAAR